MKLAQSLFAAAAALSLVQAQAAAAATAPCITEQEITGMMAFAMPSILQGVTNTCRPHLASNGFFATGGPAMITKYSARKDANWPLAKAAFIKFGSEKDPNVGKTFEALPDAALQPFVEAMMGEMIGAKIKPEECRNFERVAGLLDPLPPENTAALIGVIMSLVGSKSKGSGPNICPAK